MSCPPLPTCTRRVLTRLPSELALLGWRQLVHGCSCGRHGAGCACASCSGRSSPSGEARSLAGSEGVRRVTVCHTASSGNVALLINPWYLQMRREIREAELAAARDNEPNPEELEKYIKERFGNRRCATGSVVRCLAAVLSAAGCTRAAHVGSTTVHQSLVPHCDWSAATRPRATRMKAATGGRAPWASRHSCPPPPIPRWVAGCCCPAAGNTAALRRRLL